VASSNDERFSDCSSPTKDRPQSSTANGFQADQLPGKRSYMTREQYAASYGSDPADLAKVEAFAQAHGLVVVERSPARRSVFLSGTAANFAAAFGTTIEQFEHDGGTYRGRSSALTVPAELADIVEGVFGIDDRPWRSRTSNDARLRPESNPTLLVVRHPARTCEAV
jgi:kumamolisin